MDRRSFLCSLAGLAASPLGAMLAGECACGDMSGYKVTVGEVTAGAIEGCPYIDSVFILPKPSADWPAKTFGELLSEPLPRSPLETNNAP